MVRAATLKGEHDSGKKPAKLSMELSLCRDSLNRSANPIEPRRNMESADQGVRKLLKSKDGPVEYSSHIWPDTGDKNVPGFYQVL